MKKLVVNTQHGMGLVEVLIASSILTVLMLGVANMMASSAKSAHSIERSVGWDELISTITRTLASPSACQGAFVGQPMAPHTPFKLNLGGNILSYNQSTTYGGMLIAPAIPAPPAGEEKPLYWSADTKVIGTSGSGHFRITANIQGTDSNSIVGGNFRNSDMVIPAPGFLVTANVVGGVITSCEASPSQKVRFGPATVPGSTSYDALPLGCQNWPTPFSDMTYSVSCSGVNVRDAHNRPIGFVTISSKTPSSICVTIANEGSQRLSVDEVDCIATP